MRFGHARVLGQVLELDHVSHPALSLGNVLQQQPTSCSLNCAAKQSENKHTSQQTNTRDRSSGHIGDQLQLHCWGGWQHYCSFLRAPPRVYAMQHTLPFVSQSGRPTVISLSHTHQADRRRYACHCSTPHQHLGCGRLLVPTIYTSKHTSKTTGALSPRGLWHNQPEPIYNSSHCTP